MDPQSVRGLAGSVWALAARQHGVIARRQLLSLGWQPDAIKHRVRKGRLHPIRRGVYAVGRPHITRQGEWMAATLASGVGALLSHRDGAALWGIRDLRESAGRGRLIDVTVMGGRRPRPRGVRVHRVELLEDEDAAERDGIPVTSPIRTLIDLGMDLSPDDLERAVNAADRLGLADPDEVRDATEARRGRRGVGALRAVLDRRTFTLTDSELERKFLRLVKAAGLPRPLTQQRVNGYRVDFFWPELRLVVETDGLRYHRTPTQQSRDRARDQVHTARGFVALRFTHAQVERDSRHLVATLRAVIARQRPGLWPP